MHGADNLYLDFNGIIHNCSHPNDEDAHFRLSEEQIFTSIFGYVDHLFGKIKPKKLFFMAVDGVAPRAKMNQQRSRRFRTAKEAKDVREKAEARGEQLPAEKPFDSNCITPGTPFMVRLSEQLRYFVNKKITEDSDWRDVEVVLSGHEVPGEGEHKIMEYIRHSRAQPDYNPNVRHCMYGLDADLIMLSLLSHDPHFCLLREEVKFGPARKRGNTSLEATNFYLLHLSLLREYLDLEFRDIESLLPFKYSLERVLDDFILLAAFVGNDFLPHLPDLHIHENGLERLFDVYKKVLPGLDGYINVNGTISVKRLQIVLDEMALWEQDVFEKEYADVNWFKGKQAKHVNEMELARKRGKLSGCSILSFSTAIDQHAVLTVSQREIFDKVKTFVLTKKSKTTVLSMRNEFPARDRKFISTLGEDLHLGLRWDEFDDEDRNLVTWRFPSAVTEEGDSDESAKVPDGNDAEWEDVDDDEEDPRAWLQSSEYCASTTRLLSWMTTKMEDLKLDMHDLSGKKWTSGSAGKLEISYDDPKAMGALMYRYVEGLQWVMHYYYSGVASWGWFYDYHYAPRISDLRHVADMEFSFELGAPFKPFEQLMGVLPVASKDHIPVAYQDLMYNPTSPILDFYPLEFEQDLNGKKQDWEAVVKIPFIDGDRLLTAMKTREHRLSDDEKRRNTFGASVKFSFNHGEPTLYPSSLPGFFPPLYRCSCIMETFDLPTLDGLHLLEGLCDGVFLGADALAGFPSLKTLPHSASLGFHGVNVHGSESRNKSMIVHIQNPHEEKNLQQIGEEMVGKRTFVGWPFLQEGLVVALSDSLFKYEKMAIVHGGPAKIVSTPHAPTALGHWKSKAERIEQTYSKRMGVVTGNVDVLLHVRPLKGMKRLESGALVKDYEGADKEQEHAVQMTLSEVASEDPRFLERAAPPLAEEFPEGSKIFFLGEHAYGVAAQVSATTDKTLSVVLAFFPTEKAENERFKTVVDQRHAVAYLPSFRVADQLGVSSRAVSKITSSFLVITADGAKVNLGLSLKFEGKGMKVIDYSRKGVRGWEFSDKAVALLKEYLTTFPDLFLSLDLPGDAIAKASEIFRKGDADQRVKEAKAWLKGKGVRDLEPVSLYCDQLGKDSVTEIEKLADSFTESKSTQGIKKAIVKGIPRQAVLKPSHAVYRLQNQRFALGDRVVMVQDSGSVPLSVKGVVIGLNAKSMDVVWDVPFMGGGTLGDRCSMYRGSSVEFNTCLNLSQPQYVTSTNPAPPPNRHVHQYPHQQQQAHGAATQFRPTPVAIMANPNRGRGGFTPPAAAAAPAAATNVHPVPHRGRGRGGPFITGPPASNGLPPRGRGGFLPDRARGRGGFRGGRARGSFAPTMAS
ncbi:unnamed protein product [Mycena citricolor]|uniref:5'-3' exoribonuclease 1 n=1 Tax=Mycena citricolor TaxID=2018698 RepID=A0AAD2HXU6_9AGAR|nr:unnamed protein product [Mycena citricolor]